MREAGSECFAEIGASTKAAGADEVEGMLDVGWLDGNGLRPEAGDVLIEEEEIEVVGGSEAVEDRFGAA